MGIAQQESSIWGEKTPAVTEPLRENFSLPIWLWERVREGEREKAKIRRIISLWIEGTRDK